VSELLANNGDDTVCGHRQQEPPTSGQEIGMTVSPPLGIAASTAKSSKRIDQA